MEEVKPAVSIEYDGPAATLTVDSDRMQDALMELFSELRVARATNAKLHRRVQAAESRCFGDARLVGRMERAVEWAEVHRQRAAWQDERSLTRLQLVEHRARPWWRRWL